MRGTRLGGGVGAVGVAVLVACGGVGEAPRGPADVEQATVILEPGHCAGVVVEDGRHALTAAHCVMPGDGRVEVSLHDGRQLGGTYVSVDRGQDMAIIRLDERAPVRPLEVGDALPRPGESLLFVGRGDRPGEPQSVTLERLGRCPSLPEVPAALFTTMHGAPGDSGAPLVDPEGRVVGLVHGGARCSIAAPTAEVAPELRRLAREDRTEGVAHGVVPGPR